MSKIIESRIYSAKRQVNNVKSFITQPVGIFETADKIIETFRSANRQTLSAVTGGARAQILTRVPRISQVPSKIIRRLR